MIQIEENILSICKQTMSKGEYSKFKLPIFFYNLKNHDGHLIIQKSYLFCAKKYNTSNARKYHSKLIDNNINILFSF